jgi:serine/threonine protein kinase
VNILLAPASQPNRWVPKVADFGVAELLDGGAGLTRTGQALGSFPYLSPEQTEGNARDVGPAADVWASGSSSTSC